MSNLVCASCAHPNPPASKFCNQCGSRLAADTAAQPATAPAAGNYTPRHLAEKILTSRAALEGERKQVTVMFVDVKGSVALSQSVNVEIWHQIMDRFFAILGEAIHGQEGTINQYTGDGVMALFGAPIAHEDHAQRACLAALKIRQDLRAYAAELKEKHHIEFAVRTGLNSGEVVVGKIGDDLRMDYTAKGQSVGLAARMEQLAIPGRIFLTGLTADRLQGTFDLKERGEERVKGLRSRIKIYELRGTARHRSRFELLRAEGRLAAFVDRRLEMELLEAALNRARAGAGSLIALNGDAGVGKSRLCHELAQRARALEMAVSEVHGLPHHRTAPLLPFLDFIRSYFGLGADDSTDEMRRKVERRLTPLGLAAMTEAVLNLIGVSASGDAVEVAQAQLMQLLQAALDAGALNEPALLILDNVNLVDVDPAIAAFLDELVSRLPQGRTLLVVSYRPEYQLRWQLPHVRELRVAALERPDAEQLAVNLLGGDRSSVELAPLLAERSGGNPLFLEEILRSLLDSGALERSRHGYHLVRPIESLQLPVEVQAVVAARLDRLDEQHKRMLQTAAVIGKRFADDVLAAVLKVSRAKLGGNLATLERGEWIYQDGEGSGAVTHYAFHQGLAREVIERALLGEQRQALHLQIAQAMERLRRTQADECAALIAEHYQQAGALDPAITWHERAAVWAQGRNLSEALHHWQAIAGLAPQVAGGEEAGRCLELRARAHLLLLGARHGVAVAVLDDIARKGQALAEQCGNPASGGFFQIAHASERLIAGDLRAAKVHAQRVIDVDPATELAAAARVPLCYALMQGGELAAAIQSADEGLRVIGRRLRYGQDYLSRAPLLDLRALKGAALCMQGQWKVGAELVAKAVAACEAATIPEQQGLLLMISSSLAVEQGDYTLASRHAEAALRIVEHTGNFMVQNSVRVALARVSLYGGDWARAKRLAEAGLALIERVDHIRHEEPRLRALLAGAYLGMKQPDPAFDAARNAVRRAEQLHMPLAEIDARLALACALTARRPRGIPDSAFAELKTVNTLIERTGAAGLAYRVPYVKAALARMVGQVEIMSAALAEAREMLVALGLEQRAGALGLPG